MSESEHSRSTPDDRTIGETLAGIADPGQHVGGGTAAAIAAALAAATAALVAHLSIGRKTNRDRAADIRADLDRLSALQEELLLAAHDDEAALDTLLNLYRDRQTPEAAMIAALEKAGQTSITIARAATEVCEIAAQQAPIASRFTISDLGAAAGIARGAVTAALLTAETNVALLRGHGPAGQRTAEPLQDAIAKLQARAEHAAQAALEITRERIAQ